MPPLHLDQLAILRKGDPPAADAGLFGYDFPLDDAGLVVLPMPWEPTASYGKGTKDAPKKLVEASHQLDLWDRFYGAPYEKGIGYDQNFAASIEALSREATVKAADKAAVTALGEEVNAALYKEASKRLAKGQKVAVFGGDHSCPLGLLKALADGTTGPFGVLHIDAHHDLRDSYEGYKYSHASIMRNALESISKERLTGLTSLGIRDYAFSEYQYAKDQDGRVTTHYWEDIATRLARGETWDSFCRDALASLPEKVYISLDIDGLNYPYCPGTGTPVPGGFSYDQVLYLLKSLNETGRKIVGFDLCETACGAGGEWNLNVAARLLYRLCGVALYGSSPS